MDLSSRWAPLRMDLFGTVEGCKVKGHFKDYEVGAHCIVLWIVQCLWERGAFRQFLWPKGLHSLWAILGATTQYLSNALRLIAACAPRQVLLLLLG